MHQLDLVLRHGLVGVLRPAVPSAERYARRCSDGSVWKVTPSGVSSELGGTDGPTNRDGLGHCCATVLLSRVYPPVVPNEAAQTLCSGSGEDRPQDLIPQRDASPGWRPLRRNDQRFGWSEAVWWAWLDLNQRPHPYQGSAQGMFPPGLQRWPARTTCRWRPLETVRNRSEPMGCGPNVDQAQLLSDPTGLSLGHGAVVVLRRRGSGSGAGVV